MGQLPGLGKEIEDRMFRLCRIQSKVEFVPPEAVGRGTKKTPMLEEKYHVNWAVLLRMTCKLPVAAGFSLRKEITPWVKMAKKQNTSQPKGCGNIST